MVIDDFNNTVDIWIKELHTYSFKELSTKPDAVSWSLAQVVIHVINENKFYTEQMESCLVDNGSQKEKMNAEAEVMFLKNEFPDERIKGNELPENIGLPQSKEQLQQELLELKGKNNSLWIRINSNKSAGKARHPGLGYFNAKEWFQFAEMHLRHHLRQKKRIDEFLQSI